MKKIALILGLICGLAYAASAQCPTSPTPRQSDVTYGGAWAASGITYKLNEVVTRSGSTYIGKTCTGNLGHDPATDTSHAYWDLWPATAGTPPGLDVRYVSAAVCNGGVAYSAGLSTYDNQQPQFGCITPASSSAAYMAFQAAASPVQYAALTVATPPYWTGTDIYFNFKGTATTGNVTWIVESACTNANGSVSAVTYGTPISITTTVSTSAAGVVNSAVATNIAVPAANGCTASTSGPSSLVTFRIHRSASDSQAGDAHLLGVTLSTRRSQ